MAMPMREERVLERMDSGIARTQVTLHEAPFFYRGRIPLSYESGVQQLGSTRIVLWSQFPDFRIDYSSEHRAQVPGVGFGIRGSAVAKDAAGKPLARAEVVELTKGSGFFVREEHLDASGSVEYSAKSFFGFDGEKASEAETKGKKQRDYFFVWPTGH